MPNVHKKKIDVIVDEVTDDLTKNIEILKNLRLKVFGKSKEKQLDFTQFSQMLKSQKILR
jgi:hypothetical protein